MLRSTFFVFCFFTCNALFSQAFVSRWNTANTTSGSSGPNAITIPTNPAYTNYDYTVDWGDGNTDTNVTGNITHTYAAPGIYTVAISGTFPAIYFNGLGDRNKIIEILSWGTIAWQTMENAFSGCANLNFDAIDAPDLSQVTSLRDMFRACIAFNGIVNHWEVDTVTDMSGLFRDAIIFNRPVESWNTINVTDLSFTFLNARAFNEPLDNWNTASVTTMESTFSGANSFNQNINGWDVSQVTTMRQTFLNTNNFDMPLNNWNVSNVTDMSAMFANSRFNRPIGNWIVGNVTNMSNMFREGLYNHPLALWNVSQVTDMSAMFQRNRTFNQPLNDWDVSNVTNMASMFDGWIWGSAFNQPLTNWEVGQVTNMQYMFRDNTAFNQPIGGWDVDNVTNMQGMFMNADSFNQDLSLWNVSNVTNMSEMFQQTASFNQPLNTWTLSSVTQMSTMFSFAEAFNQPLDNWILGSVTNLYGMFQFAQAFDQDLSSWDTSQVTNMTQMFYGAAVFDQNLGGWNVANVTLMTNMLANSGISQGNYDDTLIGWAAQSVQNNVSLGATDLQYCNGLSARQSLMDDHNWTITGDSVNCSFVLCTQITSPLDTDTQVPANSDIRWAPAPNATGYRVSIRRENGGATQIIYDNEDLGNVVGVTFTNEFTPGDNVFVTVVPYNDEGPATGCPEVSFTVVESWVNNPASFKLTYDTTIQFSNHTTPINQLRIQARSGLSYNYNIDWGDGQYNNNVTGELVHTYLNPGVYTVSIIGNFPAPRHEEFNSDSRKLLSIDQWGTQVWQTMQGAFAGCENMEYNATDVPNLTNVTDMSRMFISCRNFNGNINDWDVGNVTNMSALFGAASIFDQPLDNWNVGNVTNMSLLFFRTDNFNQNISGWDTGNVTNMTRMFEDADAFNQSLDNWDVSSVTSMDSMFKRAQIFNGTLNNWNTENVTNMKEMFEGTPAFNQAIGNWDVSSVTDMSSMFRGATAFNQNINPWNVASVANMASMFNSATAFNQPLDNWNVGSVNNMSSMFSGATNFDQNINSWNVGNVINMNSMFFSALAYNQPMQDWNVASVVNMSSMFRRAERFNQPLNTWNVSAVANMTSMFENALAFDQPLDQWNVSSVTLMASLFEGAGQFNQPLGSWNVGVVTQMAEMFKNAVRFNQPLNTWNTREALNMQEMFHGATAFDQPLDNWNVTYVTNMQEMFRNATAFNQNLGAWNVASVTTMRGMFQDAGSFNGILDSWNVRRVTTMENMFQGATAFDQSLNNWRVNGVGNMNFMFRNASSFNQSLDRWDIGTVTMRSMLHGATAFDQNLGPWNVSSVSDMRDMLNGTALTRENYDNTLIAWSEQNLTPGITLGAQGLLYCDAQQERQSMITSYGWNIIADTLDCPIPVCTVLTSPTNGEVDIPVNTNLTWEPVLFANGYHLTVRVDPGNITLVNNEVVNDVSYAFATDFSGGETVYVTVVPYNDTGDAMSCTEERFTVAAIPANVPDCTALTMPLNGAVDVPVDTDLTWAPVPNADGYRLSMGTSAGGNDLLDAEDAGIATLYELANNLPEDTEIHVTIIPYNEQGDAVGCMSESFTTALIPVPPACTTMVGPVPGSTGVSVATDITWNAVDGATGYLISVGTTQGGIETVNSVDVGNQTVFNFPDDLSQNRTYYVTIIPYNEVGDAVNCTEQSFRTGTTALNLPTCTSLASPGNGSTNVAVDLASISWNPVANATGYRITINGSSSNANDVANLVVSGTAHPIANDFDHGETVTVTIVPFNADGDAMGCAPESFTIINAVPQPPTCTTLASPANGSADVAVDLASISWNPVANATGYRITINGGSSNANDVANLVVSGTAHPIANDFDHGETVTVTIVPFNADGDAVGCTTESFTIINAAPQPPTCTTLASPANGSADVAVDLASISWNPVANATGYRITINGGSSNANDVANLVVSGTAHPIANDFDHGETVTVTIVPFNADGDAVGCTTESFTITQAAPQPPTCTSLASPSNGSTNVPVDLASISWNPVANATGYRITINGGSSNANDVANLVVSGTAHPIANDFDHGETVTVTIVPLNADGDAVGCTTESFTVAPAPNTVPSCTNLTTPMDQSLDVAIDTNISWNAVANASGYLVSIGTTAGGTDIANAVNLTGTTTYPLSENLPFNTEIFVSVVPYNAVGNAVGCEGEQFITAAEPIPLLPNCTSVNFPADGAMNVPVTTLIRWNAVGNVDGYILHMGTEPNGTDILSGVDVGLTTSYQPLQDLPYGEEIYVSVLPYTADAIAENCTLHTFTTVQERPEEVESLYGFSPNGDGINDHWEIEGITASPNNTVQIFNRWGDLVFEVNGYDNQTNVFRGLANRKTQMGGDQLPSGTYFFNIQISGEHNLKKLQGFLVLKR
jgi:trimeric autotransporter adhesin